MEKRINKILLLVTIALLGPLGLGTVAAAPAPLTEANSEAQIAPAPATAPAPASVTLRPSNPPLLSKSSNVYPLLIRNWTFSVASTLYERNYAYGNSVALNPSFSPLRQFIYPGSSAGGLWRLSHFRF